MSVQNPEMFWCTEDDRMEWLFNFNVYKLATLLFLMLGKNVRKVYFLSIICSFWSLFVNNCVLYACLGWAYYLCMTLIIKKPSCTNSDNSAHFWPVSPGRH